MKKYIMIIPKKILIVSIDIKESGFSGKIISLLKKIIKKHSLRYFKIIQRSRIMNACKLERNLEETGALKNELPETI